MKDRMVADPARTIARYRRPAPGAPPGTLIADPAAPPPVVRVTRYGPARFEETEAAAVGAISAPPPAGEILWVDVEGLGGPEVVRALGDLFHLHLLALEDIVHVHQRPKVELYGDQVFVVTRMPFGDQGTATAQVSLVLGERVVLTFQERACPVLDTVRERLRRNPVAFAERGADYLAYALLDAVIDAYFPVLERYGEIVEKLEDDVIRRPDRHIVPRIHAAKRDMLTLRRTVWPQREMVNALAREDATLISAQTRLYLRDTYDHVVQLVDLLETYREIASELIDVYLSSVSARTNETMQVLTIIATLFMPLSFIASVYGMNFEGVSPWNMPELRWRFGYPFALGLMASVAAGMLYFFRRRGWLGRRRIRPRRRTKRS